MTASMANVTLLTRLSLIVIITFTFVNYRLPALSHPPSAGLSLKSGADRDIGNFNTLLESSFIDSSSRQQHITPPAALNDIDFPTLDPDYGALDPMWACSDEVRPKKLIFNHIYKTAGSSMRGLLSEYGLVCNASGVMVVSCSGLTSDSLDNRTTWYSSGGGGPDVHHRKKCQLKSAFDKQHMPLPLGDGTLKTSFLEHNHIDMLYGHQPLGSAHGWRDAAGEQVEAQYFTFFRDAMTKYVSAVQFGNRRKKLTLQAIVDVIKSQVSAERQQGKYHNTYATYLITPQQRRELSERQATIQDRTTQALRNMMEYPIIICIVERMSDSLELLQYVMDSKDEIKRLFEMHGMGSPSSKYRANKSKMSSAAVLEELKKDSAFMEEFREYVKYEDILCSFALKLHLRQHQFVQEQINAKQ
ncbi:hypothetical protein MHU86_4726 [Fragilaria crotonensis]|nr:hypothetical protein MHU86_4726 [Fragilaria crotonensis]